VLRSKAVLRGKLDAVEAAPVAADDGALRASFVHYTSKLEVDRLIAALDSLL